MLPTDVADPEQVERAAAAVENEFGPIDVWVNDAMCSVFSPVKEMTADDYKRVTEVSYLGFVYGTQAALRRMCRATAASSCRLAPPWPTAAFHCSRPTARAKHAIQGFTERSAAS